MDIAIIGAGPVGSYCGYLLAKKGHKVTIYENHAEIGLPVQCTGILTSDLDQFNFHLEKFLVNTISQIEVNTPHHSVTVKQKDYIVCRHKFDNYLADLAREAGATILLNHAFIRKERANLVIKNSVNKTEKKVAPELVIAADGPLSPTAKAFGFYHPQRENYYGIQATVEGKFDFNTVRTYFGENICPDLFAWVVPESSTLARVGLATRKNPREYFEKFLTKNNFQVKEQQAGLIPLFHPEQLLQKENCYVIGDASGFVKATTLGGIIPGLKQAQILADCIDQKKDFSQKVKGLQRSLKLNLKVRQILNKFSDGDWDKLISYINHPRISRILEEHNRDNLFPIILKSLIKEPRLLYFGKYLF